MNFWSSSFHATGEVEALAFVERSLRSVAEPVIFDVGANVGEFSAACLATFHDRCVVHAFEPSAMTYAILQTKLGDKVGASLQLHNLGLSDETREMTLYSSEVGSTIASVHQLDRPLRPFRDEFSERVQLTTLDHFCDQMRIERIDFLKLDIEGHELHALRGASALLRGGKIRFIQFEFGENNITSKTFLADFHRILGEHYRMFRIVPGGLVPWTYEGGRSEIFATMNYLCERVG